MVFATIPAATVIDAQVEIAADTVIAPFTSGQLAFTLRQNDAAGAQNPDRGRWLIDVIEAE